MRKQKFIFKNSDSGSKKFISWMIFIFFFVNSIVFLSVLKGIDIGLIKYYTSQLESKFELLEDSFIKNRQDLIIRTDLFNDTAYLSNILSDSSQSNFESISSNLVKKYAITDVIFIDNDRKIVHPANNDYSQFEKSHIIKNSIDGKMESGVIFANNMILNFVAYPITISSNFDGAIIFLDEITNQLKLNELSAYFNTDITFFIDDVRLRTTIKGENNRYLEGSTLHNSLIYKTVYTNKERFYGKNEIQGQEYVTCYAPFNFTEDTTKGILFMGINIKLINELKVTVCKILLPILLLISITIAISLELYRKKRKIIEFYSMHDPMTKTLNRYSGLKFIESQIKASKKRDPLKEEALKTFITYIDANGLKTINDNLGHYSGDEYILSIVKAIQNQLYKNETIIRLGGDEFLIVFPQSVEHSIETVCKNIINELNIINETENRKYFLSISYGIAQLDEDIDASIQKAENKMYELKRIIKKDLVVLR